MELSFEDLTSKEVIVSCSGRKLGFPKNLIVTDCGRVEALILCGKGFSLFQKGQLRIPWCDVEKIGEDVIWVAHEPPSR